MADTDDLIQKFKTIPLNSKVTLTVKGMTNDAELQVTLIEHPKQQDGRLSVTVKFKHQKRNDVLQLGVYVTDVFGGWGRRSKS